MTLQIMNENTKSTVVNMYKQSKEVRIRVPCNYKFIGYIEKVNSIILQTYIFFMVDFILQTKEYNDSKYSFNLSEILNSNDNYSSNIASYLLSDDECIEISVSVPKEILMVIQRINEGKIKDYSLSDKVSVIFLLIVSDLISTLQKTYDRDGIISYLENEYYIVKGILNTTINY